MESEAAVRRLSELRSQVVALRAQVVAQDGSHARDVDLSCPGPSPSPPAAEADLAAAAPQRSEVADTAAAPEAGAGEDDATVRMVY